MTKTTTNFLQAKAQEKMQSWNATKRAENCLPNCYYTLNKHKRILDFVVEILTFVLGYYTIISYLEFCNLDYCLETFGEKIRVKMLKVYKVVHARIYKYTLEYINNLSRNQNLLQLL